MGRSRLNVLYISRGYTTHDYRFLESFVRAGWAPVHMPITGETLETRPLPDGSRSVTWSEGADDLGAAGQWRRRSRRLREVVDQMRPDVVLAGPIQTGTFVASLAGARPLVAVSWGTDLLVDADESSRSRFITRHALAGSDAVFGDCRAVRDAARRYSCIGDDRIVTFPWGIDLARFRPGRTLLTLREELGWTGSDVFISTRSWEPLYAIDVLVRAFAKLRGSRPGARLLLLGDGSRGPDIMELIRDLGLAQFVHTPGRVEYARLPEYFRLADVYVSSALSDGTSVSLLEAMACGLPVVVNGSFGNLEWVEDGVNGALAIPGDVDSLCAAMSQIRPGADAGARMGAANMAVARRRADWEKNFPALVELVERTARPSGNQ